MAREIHVHSAPHHANATFSAELRTLFNYTFPRSIGPQNGFGASCETFWRLSPKKKQDLIKKHPAVSSLERRVTTPFLHPNLKLFFGVGRRERGGEVTTPSPPPNWCRRQHGLAPRIVLKSAWHGQQQQVVLRSRGKLRAGHCPRPQA